MNVFDRCIELKKDLKYSTKRSESIKLRVTPITLERLKETAKALNISRNELMNFILNEVLV